MESSESASRGDRLEGRILVGSALTVILAVANRVLYKLGLVPMKDYPFFMAQMTTFGNAGTAKVFICGYWYSRTLWSCCWSHASRTSNSYTIPDIFGVAAFFLLHDFGKKIFIQPNCWLLASGCGVIVAMSSGLTDGQFLSQVEYVWPALMIASSAFQAGASVLKEFVFIDAAKCLQGKLLDIFVVNSFGSGFQALFVFLLLHFLSNMRGIPFARLPTYLRNGAGCFMNVGTYTTGCEGAPLLPLLFMVVNMAFNISLLNLVKITSALVSSLAATLSVPISIYILTLPLPYIPQGADLDAFLL